jgi:quercetin dioxygenase-like cupin family protein
MEGETQARISPLLDGRNNWTPEGTAMPVESNQSAQPGMPIPADDRTRLLVTAQPDVDAKLPHIGIVGDTYTILLSGKDTAGQFCLIDMHIPPGGGPPPHRHDFEETFTILKGELEFTFRGAKKTFGSGATIHIPANAPHQFRNSSAEPARLHCICSPAGQEEFFMKVGVPVATRTTPPPRLDKAAEAEFKAKAEALAPNYRTELLPPAQAEVAGV